MSAVPAPAAPSSLSDLSALLPALAATPTPRPGQRLDLPACHGSADALAVAVCHLTVRRFTALAGK